MPIPIEVFSLADVMAKSDAARAARQQAQMNEMKMREYQQSINDQRTLGSLYGGMKQVPANITEPGIPAQPYQEQNSPESAFGLPELQGNIATAGTPDTLVPNPENTPPGRLNNQSQQLRAILQSGTDPSGNRLPGNILAKISAEADAIDEKLYQYQMQATKANKPGELSAVKLGAAYANPNHYDPLNLVPKLGVDAAKKEYRGMFDNAKSLEKVTYVDQNGVVRTEVSTRSDVGRGKNYASYKELHDDVVKVGSEFQKTMHLENGIDSLDKLFETNPTAVRDATGNLKNLPLATYLKNPAAREATAIIAGIEAEVIRKNAGLTQTESELARTKEMLARTAAYTAAEFESAFRRLQKTYADEKRLAFNKLGVDGKAIAAERFKMDPDKTLWELRKENKQPASGSAPQAAAGQPTRITNDSEYNALLPGAMFVGPDGKTRRKP